MFVTRARYHDAEDRAQRAEASLATALELLKTAMTGAKSGTESAYTGTPIEVKTMPESVRAAIADRTMPGTLESRRLARWAQEQIDLGRKPEGIATSILYGQREQE